MKKFVGISFLVGFLVFALLFSGCKNLDGPDFFEIRVAQKEQPVSVGWQIFPDCSLQ